MEQTPPLTTQDRLEISDLYARYAHAYDSGDSEGWAALFTDDGSFARAGNDPITGTEQLRRFVDENLSASPGVTHHTTSVLIERRGSEVVGRAYALVLRVDEAGATRLRNVGCYEDRFEREAGAWRFAQRVFTSKLPAASIDAILVPAPA